MISLNFGLLAYKTMVTIMAFHTDDHCSLLRVILPITFLHLSSWLVYFFPLGRLLSAAMSWGAGAQLNLDSAYKKIYLAPPHYPLLLFSPSFYVFIYLLTLFILGAWVFSLHVCL